MNAYLDFSENFYKSVPQLTPIDRHRGFRLFELHEHKIAVAAFDSIDGNDCFAYSGSIPRKVVAQCALTFRDIQHSYDLRIAVWHHSIHGSPKYDDYMDVDDAQVREMAGLGFQLGIHGHQHIADAMTHFVHLSESFSMPVVGAGSLCAGTRELPRGVNRQYNLIVIEDDLRSARVHVREIGEGEQFSRKNSGAFFPLGFVKIAWQASTDVTGRSINVREKNIRLAILQADDALHNGNERKSIELLQDIELSPGSHARRIIIKAALKLEDWELLATTLTQPQSTEEAIFLVTALIRTNTLERAATILHNCHDIDLTTRNELEGQIKTKRIMRGE